MKKNVVVLFAAMVFAGFSANAQQVSIGDGNNTSTAYGLISAGTSGTTIPTGVTNALQSAPNTQAGSTSNVLYTYGLGYYTRLTTKNVYLSSLGGIDFFTNNAQNMRLDSWGTSVFSKLSVQGDLWLGYGDGLGHTTVSYAALSHGTNDNLVLNKGGFTGGVQVMGTAGLSVDQGVMAKTLNTSTSTAGGIGLTLGSNNYYARHIAQVAVAGDYNKNMTSANDAAIIYGTAQNSVNSGFVIAPWSSNAYTSGLRLDANGNVTIGTTMLPTGYMLGVKGKIIASGLKIQAFAGWADFVFNDDYKLKSLKEVEAYIKKENHLPDVPSAEEVVTEGIDTAQMLEIQMRKIEELTLYVIELKKEIEALKK